MLDFNVIHIFGLDGIQIIREENGGSINSSESTKLSSFIDHIKTFKPEEVTLTDHHVIHIFNGFEVRYFGKSVENHHVNTSFSVSIDLLDSAIYEDFINEVVGLLPS